MFGCDFLGSLSSCLSRRTYSKLFCRVCVHTVYGYALPHSDRLCICMQCTLSINMDKCSRSMDGCIVCIVFGKSRRRRLLANIHVDDGKYTIKTIGAYLCTLSTCILWINTQRWRSVTFYVQMREYTRTSQYLLNKKKGEASSHWQIKLSSEIFIKSDSVLRWNCTSRQLTRSPSHSICIPFSVDTSTFRMECCIFAQ